MDNLGELDQKPVALPKPSYLTLTEACAQTLRRAIEEGLFAAGSQLPPEKELVASLGVSRTTLREALRSLEQQGLIIRRRGLGTFVVEAPITKDLSINSGITAMMVQAGYTPEQHPGTVRTERASTEFTAHFRSLSPETLVFVVDRVRTVNQRPVVWSLDILPVARVGETALQRFDPRTQSLYEYLAEQLGVQVTRGVAVLYPMAATAKIAARLSVRKGSPLLRITQTDYDVNDQPVLYSIEYHVPDAFVFMVRRAGPYV